MFSRTSIKRPVTTVMVTLIVFLVGIIAYKNLELAYMPSMDAPMVVVSTSYSGAGPEEMEELITKPIEETVATMTGVDSISSTSSVGSSMVMIEFVDGTDLDDATQDLREKIDRVKGRLPDDANEPTIMKMDMNSESLQIGVVSDAYEDADTLYNFCDDKLTSRFEKIAGVSSVSLSGGSDKEIEITVNPEKLQQYGISIATIRQKLSSENSNTPTGEILQGDTDLQLRAIGEFKSLDEIRQLVIQTSGGNIIQLSDVATVEEKTKDKENISLINGKQGIMFFLDKQSDANIVTVTDNINEAISQIEADYPDLDIIMLTTTADYIKTSISNVISTAFESAIIAVLILLIFLRDLRTSIIIGISIPTSIVATFAMMYLKGMTMNTISMGGIVIGIGMLVDNSVVVLENIFTYWKKGYPPKEAALKGANEVAMAVTASTLTTVAVFGPLIFVSGMIGQMLQDLAYTICFALFASLIVSLTFVPMACSVLLSNEAHKVKKKKSIFTYIGGIWLLGLEKLDSGYQKVLRLALKHRIKTVIIVIICFSASLSTIPFLGMDLMSRTDEGSMSVSIEMPNGTKYELLEEMLYKVLDTVGDIPEVEMTSARVGGGGMGGGGGSSANINYELCDKEDRERSTDDIVKETKEKLKNIAGAKITVSASANAMGSMGGGSNLSLKITGSETDTLRQISDDLIELISQIPGASEVETSLDDSIAEGNIVLNRAKAAKYGLSTSDIASAVSTAVSGSTATEYKVDGTEIDVVIKYPEDRVEYINDLNTLNITTAQGTVIPLSEVAEVTIGESAISINREDQERYITITAKFDGASTSDVQSLVQEKLNSYVFPDNYEYEFGGNMKTMQESFTSLYYVLLVAILLVYMIMASQFESIIYPFIVMFSMPLAVTGGLLGLFITGQSITVTALMGIIMLIGMVVNNAIVLVDYTNQLIRENGMECNEALLSAGPSRLRPILMTTLTTIIGLLPMAFATSSGMEIQQPLGIVVIFGLSISTLVTLVFIPVLYSLVNSLKNRINGFIKKHKKVEEDEQIEEIIENSEEGDDIK